MTQFSLPGNPFCRENKADRQTDRQTERERERQTETVKKRDSEKVRGVKERE